MRGKFFGKDLLNASLFLTFGKVEGSNVDGGQAEVHTTHQIGLFNRNQQRLYVGASYGKGNIDSI